MSFVCQCLDTNDQGHLTIGGLDVPALANEFGTPSYIMDDASIRKACREFHNTLRDNYEGDFLIAFASKALSCTYLYRLLSEEGIGADVVSGGELYTALRAGLDPKVIYFHGNNKTIQELEYALDSRIRCIVVDNREELFRLNELCLKKNMSFDIAFRLKPGIDAHTHEFIMTGQKDSKFGVAIDDGEALELIKEAVRMPSLRLKGVHCHIGSQIFDPEPFMLAVKVLMEFIKDVNTQCGVEIDELNLGGGFGIKYIDSHDPRSISEVVRATAKAVTQCAKELEMKLPTVILEPGRSIVGSAGITVYRVGSVKKIPDVRTYVAVDGGMTDNPRYALYKAEYEIVLPEKPLAKKTQTVTIAGRCCESGDIVARDVECPEVNSGELLAVMATGAYNYSMSSNYNRLPKPPIIMVKDGKPIVAVRRETYEDLVKCDN